MSTHCCLKSILIAGACMAVILLGGDSHVELPHRGDKKKAKELLEQALQQLNTQAVTGNSPRWGKQEVEGLLTKLK